MYKTVLMEDPKLSRTKADGRTKQHSADAEMNSHDLTEKYQRIRQFSLHLCKPLETEDYVIQSMPEASPTKWHLAHTSWFFETFVLKPHFPGYESAHPQYNFLFNSYYNAVGPFYARSQRGLLSRPTVKEVLHYRADVDLFVTELLERATGEKLQDLQPLIVLGLNHEQQHQELMLTDIKHVFAQNPLRPAYCSYLQTAASAVQPFRWISFDEGLQSIGHEGGGFTYDNEGPRHRVFTESFALGSRLVTNREYQAFIEDRGYQRSELWLSLGWNVVKEKGWRAPLYWEKNEKIWRHLTLGGMEDVRPDEPVCHVSFFEADAYARWADARLPSEEEWEIASTGVPIDGNFAECELFHPVSAIFNRPEIGLSQMFGDVWEWTRSSYSPYPGYAPRAGALGEYNGKFMCNQYVLRGGSCATSASHIRRTYRNFFPPEARWQFMGIRLANDVQ
jgi:ergothioneine biosynthesis protein EgtB